MGEISRGISKQKISWNVQIDKFSHVCFERIILVRKGGSAHIDILLLPCR